MIIKTKKTIAKEIIYFFSAISLLLIVWAGIQVRNSFLKNKINDLSKNISVLKIQIDSIEKANPKKTILFSQLNEYEYASMQKVLYDFDATIKAKPNLSVSELLVKFPEFKNDSDKIQSAKDYSATLNSGKYKNVSEFNYKFPEFFGVDTTENLLTLNEEYRTQLDNNIKNLLGKGATENEVISYVSDYKKKYGTKRNPFFSKLPQSNVLNNVEQIKKSKTETNQKLQETENKLFNSDELENVIIWCSIFFFGILYPFRFVFFLLKWAFKTVKQKDE